MAPLDTTDRPSLRPEHRKILQIGLCAAVIIAAVVSATLLVLSSNSYPAPPQHDTLLFCQYARAIAQGHAYRYYPDDSPTTGSTSHLYPALLAIFYKLGLTDLRLLYATLLLSILCYLFTVWFAGALACLFAPHMAWLGCALLVVSGPLVIGLLGQTDASLFTALATVTWAAFLYHKPIPAFLAITALGWTRPESILFSLSCVVAGLASFRRDRVVSRLLISAGLWGCLQFGGNLLWNYWLTGHPVWHSLVGKGYLTSQPWKRAIALSLRDLFEIARGVLFNLPGPTHHERAFYALPVIGGLSAIVGVGYLLTRDNPRIRALAVAMALYAALKVATVAISGWQGFFHDRHLCSFFVPWILFVSAGIYAIYEKRLRSPRYTRTPALALLCAAYPVITLPAFLLDLASSGQMTHQQMTFAKEAAASCLNRGQKIGVVNHPGLAYILPQFKLVDLGGYVSARFANLPDYLMSFEILKHEPEQRFDAWLISALDQRQTAVNTFLGPLLAGEAETLPASARLRLYKSQWHTWPDSYEPADRELASAEGWSCVDTLDVGYDRHELNHAYQAPNSSLIMLTRLAGDALETDVGRLVSGTESFVLRVQPHQRGRLILRTAALTKSTDGTALDCQIEVNGCTLTPPSVLLSDREFCEVMIELPAECVSSTAAVVTTVGTYASFGWWLFQSLENQAQKFPTSGYSNE